MAEPNDDHTPARTMLRRVPRLAGEALWIVLAVLLALAADQWRENRANKTLAKKALAAVIEEIEGNRALLEYMLPKHEKLLASMPDDATSWTPPAIDSEDDRFDPIFFRDVAWRTTLETRALMHLDYRTAGTLTEVYSFQEACNQLTRDLVRSSFDLEIHDPDRLEAQFALTRYFLYIFVANERLLLSTYEEALTQLAPRRGGSSPTP